MSKQIMQDAAHLGTNPGDPLPMLDGHVSHGRFERVLKAGHFAITTEIAPPDSSDPDEVLARAALFDGYVDAINATDGSGAHCLCLSGDDVGAGDHPEAKAVFDFDSISLTRTLRILRDESRFLSGRKLDLAPKLFIGSSINPFVPPIDNRVDQLAKKIMVLKDFMKRAVDMGLTENCFILPGVGVLPSAKTASWMRENVPGVHIPDHIINRLKGADKPLREGRNICVELMQEIESIRASHHE